jgi:hypothetical protein
MEFCDVLQTNIYRRAGARLPSFARLFRMPAKPASYWKTHAPSGHRAPWESARPARRACRFRNDVYGKDKI